MNDTMMVERWDGLTGMEVFASQKSVDTVLDEIAKAARSVPADATTAKGRGIIASTANKVARTKVALDGLGKDLVADWKQRSKAVDIERKRLRDSLDALKAEVRQPLTDFEAAEAARVAAIQERLEWIAACACEQWPDQSKARSIDDLRSTVQMLKETEIDESFAEFATDAAIAKDKALRTLDDLIAKRTQEEAEAAELARLRAEAAARAEADRIAAIEKAAADRARKEADEAAKAKAAKAKADADAKLERERQAKRDAEAAAERAKLETELAVKRERERVEAAATAKKAADDKRAANEKHRQRVRDAAAAAFNVAAGVDMVTAAAVVSAIEDGAIPNVAIQF